MSILLRQMMLDSPLGLWPLDEASGTTAFDRSGSGRNITLAAGEVRNAAGPASLRATTFPGTDDGGVSTDAAFSGTGDCSFSGWMQWTSGASLWTPWTWRNDGSLGERLLVLVNQAAPGSVCIYRAGNIQSSYSGGYNDGVWRHFAFTVAANVCTAYVNGAQVAQSTGSTPSSAAQGIRLGTNGVVTPNTSQRFPGGMSWVGAYGTALSPTRIKEHYLAGIGSGVVVG